MADPLAALRHIIERTLQEMPAQDRAERVAWCQATGEHGVRVKVDDGVWLWWGGRPLALIEDNALDGDTDLQDLVLDELPPIPDDPRGL